MTIHSDTWQYMVIDGPTGVYMAILYNELDETRNCLYYTAWLRAVLKISHSLYSKRVYLKAKQSQ